MNFPSLIDVGLVAYLRGWPDDWLHIEGRRYDTNLYKFKNIYLVLSSFGASINKKF
jgi:hypothetical protein